MKNLFEVWEKSLKPLGVKLPKDSSWKRKTLEYLYKKEGEWVSKEAIICYIGYDRNDLQAPRHLPSSGWYIEQDFRGNYKLVSSTEILPNWIPEKRKTNIRVADWEGLKAHYKNKCASCGSDEGQPHNHTGKITKLEKGHKNPDLDLTIKNMIPQCNYCNKRYKDMYIFDSYGIAVEIKLNNIWNKIPNYNRN
jgi:hypothetical protein